MPRVTESKRLNQVEHILASGTGTLDFAVAGKSQYFTWEGLEDDNWTVEGVAKVENTDEDRLLIYPEGEFFTCEITVDSEEEGESLIRCRSK